MLVKNLQVLSYKKKAREWAFSFMEDTMQLQGNEGRSIIHYGALPYEVALAEAAEHTRGKFTQIINRGKEKSPSLMEELLENSPKDYLVDTALLDFECSEEAGITVAFGSGRFPIHRNAIHHLAQRSEIFTIGVMDKMMKNGSWAQEMLTDCLRRTYRNIDRDRVLVRVSRGKVKAILSDSYLRIDSADLVASVIEALMSNSLVVTDAQVGEVSWSITAAIPSIFEPIKNDPIMWGFQITNSDYGKGALSIKTLVERLMCTNKATIKDVYNRVHLGAKLPDNIVLAQDTLKAQSAFFTGVFRDFMSSFLDRASVSKEMKSLHATATSPVPDHEDIIKTISKKSGITAGTSKEVAEAYTSFDVEMLPPAPKEGSLWRLSNAFSLIANQRTDFDEVQALQSAAGQVLLLA